MLESLKRAVLDALFPPLCIGCRKSGTLICEKCESSLPRHLPPFCSLCAKPLSTGRSPLSPLCPRCLGSPLAIDGVRSVFKLEGVVREGVHHLKYRGVTSLAGPFASHMGSYLAANPLPVDAIIPVPLHPRRLKERGYNQSALLARAVAQKRGLEFLESALTRVKDTPAQVRSASAEERRRNVQGAFQVRGDRVRGLKVLVIDDVCTTGSTLEACSAALRAAGARSVWGLTLARDT